MDPTSRCMFPVAEPMYNMKQPNSPFSANVSSYFKRPTKIVKSRNSSPRHSVGHTSNRRRTTSNISVSRTRSMLDRQHPSFGPYRIHQQGRPLSWHHTSYMGLDPSAESLPYTGPYQQLFANGTAAVNGAYTPMSCPVADEPQIQELITPLESLSAQEVTRGFKNTSYPYPLWSFEYPQEDHLYIMDTMFPQPPTLDNWQWDVRFPIQKIPTAPASPAFLPIQGTSEASPLSLERQNLPPSSEGEELVGMGLYDSPADVQSASLLFGGSALGRRKSLKLEESFEPPPENEDDGSSLEEDAQAEEDENSEPEACEQFPTFQEHPHIGSTTLAGQSFLFDAEADNPSLQMGMANSRNLVNAGLHSHGMGYGWF